jgi:hypothetical protein
MATQSDQIWQLLESRGPERRVGTCTEGSSINKSSMTRALCEQWTSKYAQYWYQFVTPFHFIAPLKIMAFDFTYL